jgi:Na+/proline symporter
MHTIDWIVLSASLLFIVVYGVWKGRGNRDIRGFFLANRGFKWYTVALSIMATQASAITFLSGPGQGYFDGMRFVQFYFGLPLAMIILSITAVPIFHRLNVFTAYEYLESRFDLKTRLLAAFLFLTQRGLAAGLTIFAPSIILSVILGWNIYWTNIIVGVLVITYTALGGTRAVNLTHFYQMIIIMFGMLTAFFMVINLLPEDISLFDAVRVAGNHGKLNTLDFKFDLFNRYTIWSGLIGGLFLQLSYFGTDQSQVQRYLTGESVTQSRLALLFNGFIKIPMQFFILFIGILVFAFFQFETPPLFFNSVETENIQNSPFAAEYEELQNQFESVSADKQTYIRNYLHALETDDDGAAESASARIEQRNQEIAEIRSEAVGILQSNNPQMDTSDTNYVFLHFVVRFLPVGVVGLIIAAIIAASMSSTAGELNALASTTVVDFYKRIFRKEESDKSYLVVSKVATLVWGIYAILLAEYASRLGSLIEAVNVLGSLFYGTILGIFLVAFYLKRISGTAVFISAFIAEVGVILVFWLTDISFLWYNVIGCLGVVGLSSVIDFFLPASQRMNV